MLNNIAYTLAFVMLSATGAHAAVTFSNYFVEPSKSDVAVAFFTALSTTDDAIVGVGSDCCTAVEIHTSEMKNNIMRMRKLDKLALKANVPTQVQRAGESLHVMLIGLKMPLKQGNTVDLTFTFKKAAKKTVTFSIGENGVDCEG